MSVNRVERIFFWGTILVCFLVGASQIFPVFSQESTSALIINEFVAVNRTGLTDQDGDYSDWIEIYNRSDQAVNLSGWSLTDDPNQPEKWSFPNMTLASQAYLVVFASGKDRQSTEPSSELHTNFKLGRQGEFLGLYSIIQGKFMDTVSAPYPEQLRDIAYGRYGEEMVYGYLANPTPGEANEETAHWVGIVSPVQFSISRGFYDSPFTVELTTDTPGATIHYTTDGREPTETTGLTYTGPITINTTTLLRAVAFKTDFLPSRVDTHSYIFLDEVVHQPPNPAGFPPTWGTHPIDFAGYKKGAQVVADYELDPEIVNDPRYRQTIKDDLKSIPTMSIVTDVQNFYLYANPRERGRAWERPVSVELIDTDPSKKGFQINAGIRIQGGAGRWEFMPKHSFRLFFRDEYGPTRLEYPLFPDSPVETFDTIVLRGGADRSYAGHPDVSGHALTTYTRDEWLRASQIAMSGLGAHGIFVHLYLNGLYWGLYNLVERPDARFTASYLGGEPEGWYIANHRGGVSGSSGRFKTLLKLASDGGLADSEKYAAIKPYLDIDQFIDYLILNWYAGTRDWPENNWYAGLQNPSGQARYFVWDGEECWIDGAKIHLGKEDLAGNPNTIKILFEALIENADFKMRLADRLFRHLFHEGALTDANAQARWLAINSLIERAIVGESARWGDARYERPITRDDWLKARDNVLAQMEGNGARLIGLARDLGYYPELDPPTFNQQGGLVTTGFKLTMIAPTGIIYYTTDGSDPRIPVSGAIAPSALVYNAPLLLTGTTTIKARVLADGPATLPATAAGQLRSSSSGQASWSALNEVTFRVVGEDKRLRLTEIMYNPIGGGDYEFIELKNTGRDQVYLSNMFFEGILFTFPPGTPPLAPGEFVVLVRNRAAFAERYPDVSINGVYDRQLSNKGEQITLKDARGNVIVSVKYDDENGWPISPDGRGDSLVFVVLDGDPNDPKNWRASVNLHGSPGADEPMAGVSRREN